MIQMFQLVCAHTEYNQEVEQHQQKKLTSATLGEWDLWQTFIRGRRSTNFTLKRIITRPWQRVEAVAQLGQVAVRKWLARCEMV